MSISSTSAHETRNLSKFSPASRAERRKVVQLSSGEGVFYTIIERNGHLAPFNLSRVRATVEATFRSTHRLNFPDPLPEHLCKTIDGIVGMVGERYSDLASRGACLSVEGIQDILEEKFLRSGLYEVAKQFAVSRAQRRAERQESLPNLRVLTDGGRGWTHFNPEKLTATVARAFQEAGKYNMPASQKTVAAINAVSDAVSLEAQKLALPGGVMTSKQLADVIEEQLMAAGLYQVAKHFILSRSRSPGAPDTVSRLDPEAPRISRRQIVLKAFDPGRTWTALDRFGCSVQVTETGLRNKLERLAAGLPGLDTEALLAAQAKALRDGLTLEQIDLQLIETARKGLPLKPGQQQLMVRLLLATAARLPA